MTPELQSILRCPYCQGPFAFDAVPVREPLAARSGVLRCSCSEFPVIDGIPIIQRAPVGMFEHTTGHAQVEGVAVGELVSLLRAGRDADALLACLVVPQSLPALADRVLPWRIAHGDVMKRLLRAPGKRRLLRGVLARRRDIGARDVLEFFYPPGSPLGFDVGQYFVRRFCQPRHLAALSLLATVPGDERAGAKPVLDIACGLGHLEHYLTNRRAPVRTVGTDMNFFHAWIAQHWFAPSASFVCANAADALCFADDTFEAVVCSDAWHYIPNRQSLLKEVARVAPGRTVFLTRVGNRDVIPNEGAEQSLPEYLADARAFGGPDARAFSESELLRCYLRGQNPLARPATDAADLAGEKWLSFAWNISREVRDDAANVHEWPHAVGHVGVNPIYRFVSRSGDTAHLRFEFPVIWYAYENHEMLSYHPREATLGTLRPERWQAWRDDPAIRTLVRSFVLIGLPERFGGA